MRALPIVLLALAAVALVPSPAAAQQSGAITIQLFPATEALREDGGPVAFQGIVTYTADLTMLTSIAGVPVSYTVTKQPAWASVIVSPATDVFPYPSFVPTGVAYTAERAITITVSLADAPSEDTVEMIEITATTTPGILGKSFSGKGNAPIAFDAPIDPCPEHAGMTRAQMIAYAETAADAYEDYQASQADDEDPDVTVQNAEASPISLPWVAVAAFALVGAGVGLALNRRFGR